MDAERMRAALHEVWKYYDEAGESGENYVLAPDNLGKFAADLCKEYQNLDTQKAIGLVAFWELATIPKELL